ncbi:MAG: ribosome biogenesis GTPase Der, partial [Spirochaetota bacterium]
AEAYNFYEYGFPHLLMVSALHRRGLEPLRCECVHFLQQKRGQEEVEPPEQAAEIRFALIGKPNTGKSTLYNLLAGADASIVSDMPGTTRDVLRQRFTRGDKVYELMDTAGIRRKSKVGENVEYYSVNRALKSLDDVDVAVLLIDSCKGIQQQDKKIARQIIKRGRGFVFALNKVDLLDSGTKNAIRSLEEDTRDLFPHLHYAPICSLSALSGKGTRQLLGAIDKVYEQLNRRINTGLLNQALQDWVRTYSPPGNGSLRFKVRYLTQVEVNPLRFILFVNHSRNFPQSYLSFLQNQIRKELGFMNVPLHLHLHDG